MIRRLCSILVNVLLFMMVSDSSKLFYLLVSILLVLNLNLKLGSSMSVAPHVLSFILRGEGSHCSLINLLGIAKKNQMIKLYNTMLVFVMANTYSICNG